MSMAVDRYSPRIRGGFIARKAVNASAETLDKHYSQLTQREKMEQRRGYLDNI